MYSCSHLSAGIVHNFQDYSQFYEPFSTSHTLGRSTLVEICPSFQSLPSSCCIPFLTVISSLVIFPRGTSTVTNSRFSRVLAMARTCVVLSLFLRSLSFSSLAIGLRSWVRRTSVIVTFPSQIKITASADDKERSEAWKKDMLMLKPWILLWCNPQSVYKPKHHQLYNIIVLKTNVSIESWCYQWNF